MELRAAHGPAGLLEPPGGRALALSVGIFLNPAGNAGIGAYRVAVTPRELLGRSQADDELRVDVGDAAGAACSAGVLLATLGGAGAVAALIVACALTALVPTLSRSVRAVPRPAVWQAELAQRTPDPVVAAA